MRSARLLTWQERLAALRDLLLWDHALFLGLQIYRLAAPPPAAEASQAIAVTSDFLYTAIYSCRGCRHLAPDCQPANLRLSGKCDVSFTCLLSQRGVLMHFLLLWRCRQCCIWVTSRTAVCCTCVGAGIWCMQTLCRECCPPQKVLCASSGIRTCEQT